MRLFVQLCKMCSCPSRAYMLYFHRCTDQSVNHTDQSVNHTDQSVNHTDQSANRTDQSVNPSDVDISLNKLHLTKQNVTPYLGLISCLFPCRRDCLFFITTESDTSHGHLQPLSIPSWATAQSGCPLKDVSLLCIEVIRAWSLWNYWNTVFVSCLWPWVRYSWKLNVWSQGWALL